jgi:type I restriction enzyme M protein
MAKASVADMSTPSETSEPTPAEAAPADPLLGPEPGSPGPIKTLQTVTDYISGKQVKASAEEIEAVQVFARKLVDDLGYPKSVIQTRPQYRVRSTPSGGKAKGYPIDIAVFSSDKRLESELQIVVECKRKNRKDGEEQLKIYMGMAPSAQIGVWFNGNDHLYLLREVGGWSTLPTLPKFGQSVDDIGVAIRRRDLTVAANLKAIFRDIRNHLAGNTVGIAKDEALAVEIISVLFCKIYDEINSAPDDLPEFRVAHTEDSERVKERIEGLFSAVKAQYPDVFRTNEEISLDPESLRYVVGELQNYCLVEATRDAIGDAFEVFIGPATRGEEGQFFTPRNVVRMMVDVLDPRPGDKIVDPACGSGGFLIVALERVWKRLEAEAVEKNWSEKILEQRRRDVASRCFRGLDKDGFLTKVTKAYMAIIGDGRGGVFCEDALSEPKEWHPDAKAAIPLGTFDVVVTNPPFGSKIKVKGEKKLGQYELAKRWVKPKEPAGDWKAPGGYKTEQSPQVLFIERCANFLKPNGRMAIVLPESIFGMPVYGYVVQYLFDKFSLRGFVSLPEEVFQPYTHAKTCVLFVQKRKPASDENIEMAIADWCGHDSRGNPAIRTGPDGPELLDDLPQIALHMSNKGIWA